MKPTNILRPKDVFHQSPFSLRERYNDTYQHTRKGVIPGSITCAIFPEKKQITKMNKAPFSSN